MIPAPPPKPAPQLSPAKPSSTLSQFSMKIESKEPSEVLEVISQTPYKGLVMKLTVRNCSLIDLSFLKDFNNLVYLDLSDNFLTESNLKEIANLPLLTYLFLAGNKLKSPQVFKDLKAMVPGLKVIGVGGALGSKVELEGVNFFSKDRNLTYPGVEIDKLPFDFLSKS